MKLVKIVLRTELAVKLRDALVCIGCHGVLVRESLGYGEHRKIVRHLFEGKPYEIIADYNKRTELELVVFDDRLKIVLHTIRENASTAKEGDGRVYVVPIEESFHIHSGNKHTGNYGEEEWGDDVDTDGKQNVVDLSAISGNQSK